jgi:UDP-glucose 4-epimerase
MSMIGPYLVVGGAGFIGSHVVQALQRLGAQVVVLDNLTTGHAAAVGSTTELVQGDFGDAELLRDLFGRHHFQGVFHFGALSLVGASMKSPGDYWRVNVAKMITFLIEAERVGIKCIVYSSSAAVYGDPTTIPMPESHQLKPKSPYGSTKVAVERILSDFEAAHGIRSACLRYFNAAGSDPEGVIGEDHRPESHLIPRAILAAMGQEPSLPIYGTNYETPDGTCIRDYVHVCDLADGHIAAMQKLHDGASGLRLNLGSGQGHSVAEVLDAVHRVTSHPVPVIESGRRAGDPAVLVADVSEAKRQLNWTFERSTLDQMVRDAWNWRKNNPNGYPN